MKPLSKFPEILKSLRKANQLSVRKAAKRFGISPSLLQRYESGEVMPGMGNMEKISDAIGVSVDTLMGRRGAA
jgi:transcriptional regulator with XRE-family HTH domain